MLLELTTTFLASTGTVLSSVSTGSIISSLSSAAASIPMYMTAIDNGAAIFKFLSIVGGYTVNTIAAFVAAVGGPPIAFSIIAACSASSIGLYCYYMKKDDWEWQDYADIAVAAIFSGGLLLMINAGAAHHLNSENNKEQGIEKISDYNAADPKLNPEEQNNAAQPALPINPIIPVEMPVQGEDIVRIVEKVVDNINESHMRSVTFKGALQIAAPVVLLAAQHKEVAVALVNTAPNIISATGSAAGAVISSTGSAGKAILQGLAGFFYQDVTINQDITINNNYSAPVPQYNTEGGGGISYAALAVLTIGGLGAIAAL